MIPERSFSSNDFARCTCNPGFVGNGFDCFNATTGHLDTNSKQPEVDIILVTHAAKAPLDVDISSLDLGNTTVNLGVMINVLDQGGQSCSTAKCNLNPDSPDSTCQI